jgi:hypothetical protein
MSVHTASTCALRSSLFPEGRRATTSPVLLSTTAMSLSDSDMVTKASFESVVVSEVHPFMHRVRVDVPRRGRKSRGWLAIPALQRPTPVSARLNVERHVCASSELRHHDA